MNTRFWDFVAALFALYGIIIAGAGVYYWVTGVKSLATQWHPSLWWGIVMILAAVIFYLLGKQKD